jgi:Chaperone of endosialidase
LVNYTGETMKNHKYYLTLSCLLFALASFAGSALAQSDGPGRISASGQSVRWEVNTPYSAATITIATPDGQVIRKEVNGGGPLEVLLSDKRGDNLPDGVYNYELRLAPIFSASVKEALKAAREKGNEGEVQRDLRKRGLLPAQAPVQSGSFSIINGSIILPGAIEEPGTRVALNTTTTEQPQQSIQPRINFKLTPAGQAKVRQHHFSALRPFDFVIADDLIVQGSACVGLDCVDGESFGFDTIRVKENNTRIQFDDTSTSAGFATNNWQIRANAQGSGGGAFLAFVDQGSTGNSETGTIVFEVDAGAPANSLRVSSGGNIGVGTATPVLDVHVNTTDTPAMRLEQNNSGGFTAQTWDVAGNEANFFVRDVTSGSRLPFRIRPGAPTSSIDISASGDVGINMATPSGTKMHIFGGNDAGSTNGLQISSTDGLTTEYGFFSSNAASNYSRLGYWTGSALGNLFIDVGATGRVGIGTNAPDQMLSVNGGASKSGGGSWSVFSDERLKSIKGNYTSGLKAVMQLQPIRYQYSPKNPLGLNAKEEYVGFGAEAVKKVIPEAVTKSDSGYLMVNNDPIILTMLNAIKEQQQEIQQLKKEIRQLRASHRRRK